MRVDKTCLMALERTLHLFRSPDLLRREHPTYRMMAIDAQALRARAQRLVEALAASGQALLTGVVESVAYLGSGSLPTESIPSIAVTVRLLEVSASELARRLRMDEACVFGRIEDDLVHLDMRTITDAQVPFIAAALQRIAQP
jgi:L-seryl-tRNA(Ser) seleniumtransferase